MRFPRPIDLELAQISPFFMVVDVWEGQVYKTIRVSEIIPKKIPR